jgi:hypothetical protein
MDFLTFKPWTAPNLSSIVDPITSIINLFFVVVILIIFIILIVIILFSNAVSWTAKTATKTNEKFTPSTPVMPSQEADARCAPFA